MSKSEPFAWYDPGIGEIRIRPAAEGMGLSVEDAYEFRNQLREATQEAVNDR